MRKPAERQGFTLIELMIVVAIIGILAALAIPTFIKYQYRSRSAEAPVNMRAIQSSEFSYFARSDVFRTAQSTPDGLPGNYKVSWSDAAAGFEDFSDMGYRPEGTVYFRYQVDTSGASFALGAVADVDGNNVYQQWADVHPDTTGTVSTIPYGITVPPEFREQVVQISALDIY